MDWKFYLAFIKKYGNNRKTHKHTKKRIYNQYILYIGTLTRSVDVFSLYSIVSKNHIMCAYNRLFIKKQKRNIY